jgi:hypothetical protein
VLWTEGCSSDLSEETGKVRATQEYLIRSGGKERVRWCSAHTSFRVMAISHWWEDGVLGKCGGEHPDPCTWALHSDSEFCDGAGRDPGKDWSGGVGDGHGDGVASARRVAMVRSAKEPSCQYYADHLRCRSQGILLNYCGFVGK